MEWYSYMSFFLQQIYLLSCGWIVLMMKFITTTIILFSVLQWFCNAKIKKKLSVFSRFTKKIGFIFLHMSFYENASEPRYIWAVGYGFLGHSTCRLQFFFPHIQWICWFVDYFVTFRFEGWVIFCVPFKYKWRIYCSSDCALLD